MRWQLLALSVVVARGTVAIAETLTWGGGSESMLLIVFFLIYLFGHLWAEIKLFNELFVQYPSHLGKMPCWPRFLLLV